MGSINDLLTIYRQLFSGNTSFHGVHKYRASKTGEKEEGESYTKDDTVTEEQYKNHLNGTQGLGICPIREDSTCAFGAIDVDIYSNDSLLTTIVDNIYKWNLPLLPFRSKSGGLHLYLFLEQDPSSLKLPTGSEIIRLLSRLSELLSIQKQEIFPKQSVFRPGKKGNWINLPYFNTDNSRQYLIGKNNLRVLFDDAIKTIQSKRGTLSKIENDLETLPFGDGPPCLQRILLNGGPDENGGRNSFLFNAAIYHKEKDHTSFDVMVDEVNDNMRFPLDERELTDTVKRSVIKKEYTYACHEVPLCDNCNKELCATRKYGIGQNNGLFMGLSLGQLTIHRGKGVSYSWEITKENESEVIHLDSPRDLRNQEIFIDSVLTVFNYKVSRVKAEKWDKLLNSALEGAIEDSPELADENTLQSRLTKMVLEFISRHISEKKIDIERGFAYKDSEKNEVLFKQDDVWQYLIDNKKQRGLRNADFQAVLSEMGVPRKTKVTRLGSKVVRVKTVSLSDIEKMIEGRLEPLQDIDWESEAEQDEY